MKHGKRPSNKHKSAMAEAGLNPKQWLVIKNLEEELHIVNRETSEIRVIPA